MELTAYSSIARRWWRRILATTVAGAFVGLLAVSLLPPTYEGRALLLVGPVNTDLDTQNSAGRLARTYASLITSRAVLDPVAQKFGVDVKELADRTQTTASETTRFMTIVVEDDSRAVAAGAANEMVAILIKLVGADPPPEGAITIVDAADASAPPIGPIVPLIVALTTVSGFVTAMLLLILGESFSEMVRDQEDIGPGVDVPVVAVLTRQVETSGGTRGTRAADLAMVTGRLIASSRSRPNVQVAVAGTGTGNASAHVTARLAVELATFGGSVSVIDAGSGRVAPLLRALSDPPETGRTTGAEVETLRVDGGKIRLVHRLTIASTLSAAEQGAGVTVVHVDSPTSSVVQLRWIEIAAYAVLVVGLDESRREDLHRGLEVLKVLGADNLGIVVVKRDNLLQRRRWAFLRLRRRGLWHPARQTAAASMISPEQDEATTKG